MKGIGSEAFKFMKVCKDIRKVSVSPYRGSLEELCVFFEQVKKDEKIRHLEVFLEGGGGININWGNVTINLKRNDENEHILNRMLDIYKPSDSQE